MRYVTDTPLQLAHRPWQLRPPQPSLTLIAKGTFDLTPDGVATFSAEATPPTGEEHRDDDVQRGLRTPSDFALIKPAAELLVIGKAYTPRREPRSTLLCGFRLGAIAKRFCVLGDRQWRGPLHARLDAPSPFTEMALDVERAYGGPDLEANPLGVGRRGHTDEARRHALPNLEDPDALIDAPSAAPAPMIVGPLPAWWPSRRKLAGRYDGDYAARRWPWLPEDFDFAYFMEGPRDQRVEGFFRGDERLQLSNLHPDHPELRCQLPSIRPRCFLDARGTDGATTFQEIPLRLDTVIWDGERAKLFMVWRGIAELDAIDDARLPHVFVTHEPLHESRPAAHHRARFDHILATERAEEAKAQGAAPPPVDAPVHASTDFDDVPETVVHAPGAPPPDSNDAPAEATQALDVDPLEEDALQQRMAALGVPTATPTDDGALAEETPLDPETMRAKIAAAGLDVEGLDELLAAQVTPPDEDTAVPVRDEFDIAAGTVFDPMAGPPIRDRIKGRVEAGESLRGVDFTGVDLSRLDLSGQDLTGAILRDATLVETNLSDAVLRRAILRGATLHGAIARRADLGEADLAHVDATKVDLSGAFLEDADLEGAQLGGAILRQLRAARASFLGADLEQAVLFESDLLEADLSDARLVRADLARTRLTDATLEGSVAHAARFDGAELLRVRGEAMLARQARFRAVVADGAFFEHADLGEADFSGSKLAGADFSDAVLLGATFDACVLRGARFERAQALRLSAQRSDLFEANFQDAILSFANLRGSNLYTAELWRALVDHVELADANLDGTLLAP